MKGPRQRAPEKTNKEARKVIGRALKDVVMPVAESLVKMPVDYPVFFAAIKERIARERIKAVMAANAAMVLMYWDIGAKILEKQNVEGWGAKIVDRLSHDLKAAFPEMNGFSPRNLKYMRKFAECWPDRSIVQEALAQITWYHNLALLEKLPTPETRLWYARKTLEHGWSRNILTIQIDTRLHEREGKAINNFPIALPPVDSDMAEQVFKDPYVFDFLGTADLRRESELERKLVDHIQKFLL